MDLDRSPCLPTLPPLIFNLKYASHSVILALYLSGQKPYQFLQWSSQMFNSTVPEGPKVGFPDCSAALYCTVAKASSVYSAIYKHSSLSFSLSPQVPCLVIVPVRHQIQVQFLQTKLFILFLGNRAYKQGGLHTCCKRLGALTLCIVTE